MAFAFKRKETIGHGIRRIGCERLAHALAGMECREQLDAVHVARKDLKKLRALLRLSRHALSRKQFRQRKRRVRDIARSLAPVRDAQVKSEALRRLAAAPTSLRGQSVWSRLRPMLRAAMATELKRFKQSDTGQEARSLMHQELKAWRRLPLSKVDWPCLEPAIRRTFARGRAAFLRLDANSTPPQFHRWRKRAKDTWYHLRLLLGACPAEVKAFAGELDALTTTLGDMHDLFVLWQEIEGSPATRDTREQQAAHKLIERPLAELRRTALAAGARIYRDTPTKFSQRLTRYWQAWRP